MAMVGFVGFSVAAVTATTGSTRAALIVLMYLAALWCLIYIVRFTPPFRVYARERSNRRRAKNAIPRFDTLIVPPLSSGQQPAGGTLSCYFLHKNHRKIVMTSSPFPFHDLPGLRCVFRMRTRVVTVRKDVFDDTGLGSIRVDIPTQFTVSGLGGELKHAKLTAKWKIDTKARHLAKTSVKWTGHGWDRARRIKIRDFFRHYWERDTPSTGFLNGT